MQVSQVESIASLDVLPNKIQPIRSPLVPLNGRKRTKSKNFKSSSDSDSDCKRRNKFLPKSEVLENTNKSLSERLFEIKRRVKNKVIFNTNVAEKIGTTKSQIIEKLEEISSRVQTVKKIEVNKERITNIQRDEAYAKWYVDIKYNQKVDNLKLMFPAAFSKQLFQYFSDLEKAIYNIWNETKNCTFGRLEKYFQIKPSFNSQLPMITGIKNDAYNFVVKKVDEKLQNVIEISIETSKRQSINPMMLVSRSDDYVRKFWILTYYKQIEQLKMVMPGRDASYIEAKFSPSKIKNWSPSFDVNSILHYLPLGITPKKI